jgi:hypothetical protein
MSTAKAEMLKSLNTTTRYQDKDHSLAKREPAKT